MPVIPDCRIQNSVYMIGEKVSTQKSSYIASVTNQPNQGADMIKAQHKDLYESKNIPYFVQSKL